MQIDPRQVKNFKILRDRVKGRSQFGARLAEHPDGGGAVTRTFVPELHSYAEELLQGHLSLEIISFCADCPCRSVYIIDGRMPPISGGDFLCDISREAARFVDEMLGL